MSSTTHDEASSPKPVGWRFMALYTLANVGGYIAFIPLLQVLVPLRAAAIDPVQDVALLSRVSLCGAVVASLANILFGALSDRTLHATGGRRPWLLVGLVCVVLSFAVIRAATTPLGLMVGVIAFQLAFNAMFSPLGAVLADRVQSAQRGLVSGLLGLGYPLGNLIGTQVVGNTAGAETPRFMILAVVIMACILPFAWALGPGDRPPQSSRRATVSTWRADLRADLRGHADFALALAGRLLVVTAFSLLQGYLLIYLRHLASLPGLIHGRPEAAFAGLAAIVTCASTVCAIGGGALSDRVGRRGLFVFAAGASMAVGMMILSEARSWHILQIGSLVYGCGAGQFYAVDLALIVQVLPSLRRAGQNLGIVNLSNTVPQIISPLIAMVVLTGGLASFRMLFLLAAAAAFLGGACVLGIKRTRLGRERALF